MIKSFCAKQMMGSVRGNVVYIYIVRYVVIHGHLLRGDTGLHVVGIYPVRTAWPACLGAALGVYC